MTFSSEEWPKGQLQTVNMKPRQVPFFLYWRVENVQFWTNSIGHLGWLSRISNIPRFHKNVNSLEPWKYISENQPSGFKKIHSKNFIIKKDSLRLVQLSTLSLPVILFLYFFVLRCWFSLQGANWFSRKKTVWTYPSPMLAPLWRFLNVTVWAVIRNGITTRKA